LAMDMENAALTVPSDPDKSVQQMHQLWAQVSEVGEDLHRLSRNLHPSILDVLGLAQGIGSLCAEFTEQQGLQVEFTSNNVPRTIPSGSALCLYRITQEGLRNVKKHSGANKAFVQLNGNCKEITLMIVDAGIGFDADEPAFKAGLGLRSMKERLRSVGGTIEIQSQHKGGTQISVHAPLA